MVLLLVGWCAFVSLLLEKTVKKSVDDGDNEDDEDETALGRASSVAP